MTDDELKAIVNPYLGGEWTWFTPYGVFDKNGKVTKCAPPNSHHWNGDNEQCECGAVTWDEEFVSQPED